MSHMRKCAKCRVYQIFRCTRSSSCARERDDGGYNKEPQNSIGNYLGPYIIQSEWLGRSGSRVVGLRLRL